MTQISYAGAFSSADLNVPDVYLNVAAPSGSIIRPASIGVLAMVGIASWGPVNAATPIGSPGALSIYGSQKARKYDLYSGAALALQVQSALGAGAGLLLNRVSDGTDTAASAYVGLKVTAAVITEAGGGTDYTVGDTLTFANGLVLTVATASTGVIETVTITTPAATSELSNPASPASTSGSGAGATFNLTYANDIEFTSLYTGTAGNGAKATIAAGSKANSHQVTLSQPGLQSETFNNITGSGAALWAAMAAAINNGNSPQRGPSKIMVATAGTGTDAATDGSTTLVGGTDGEGVESSDIVGSDGSSRTGVYVFRGTGCSDGVCCDLDDHTQNATLATFAESEGILWGVQNTIGDTPSDAATQKTSDGTDTPWLYYFVGDWTSIQDNVNGVQRQIGPATLGMAVSSTLQPQESTLNKQTPLVVTTQRASTGLPYANDDLLTLTTNGLEVIANPIPAGPMFGCRIGRNASSDQTRNTVNWPRLTSFLARSLAGPGALGPAIGEVITDDFFDTWYAVLDNYLSGLLNATPTPVIEDYQINFSTANNPQSQTATGLVVAEVLIQYLGIAQVFLVNMQTGATVVIPQNQSSFATAA